MDSRMKRDEKFHQEVWDRRWTSIIFVFWDKEEEVLIVATHDIIKKTQKTPPKEIAKAEDLRNEYFKNK